MKEIKKRDEIDSRYKWRVDKIYKDIPEWEKDFGELKKEAPALKDFEGKLDSGEKILEYLKLDEKIARKAEKLFIYAHLKNDEDTANSTYVALKSRIDMYFAELSSYTAYFVPEILSLEDGFIEKEIDRVEGLKEYEFMFKDILKEKPHVLTKEKEGLIAALSDCLDAPSNVYKTFTNADMSFGKIKDEDGNEVELSEGNYSGFIKSKKRSVREEAFKRLFGEYEKYKNTLAATLTGSIKTDVVSSKLRNYNSAVEASLKPNNIPVEVYKNAVKVIDDNVDALHRYVKIKKKLLGLDEIHMYDLYVPVIDSPKIEVEFEDAVNIVLDALKPLGDEYLDIFKFGISEGWIDVYENKGKRGGAYSWGCYDTQPYVLLNYNNELNDVSTLAHEMGHSIHSYYSHKNQPYHYSGYALFCAEVASTTNESLLIHYLINKETDKNKKLYLINQELEQIRTTVFRQLMFAEFELYTHEQIENGTPLTSDDLNAKWHELNVKYFGDEIIVDKEIDVEWARIPHFYTDFYVYQYATGYSAASAFSNAILSGKPDAVEKYKGFLKSGGSDYPIEILKKAGVDMTSKEPVEATIKRFNELLDMLEKEI